MNGQYCRKGWAYMNGYGYKAAQRPDAPRAELLAVERAHLRSLVGGKVCERRRTL